MAKFLFKWNNNQQTHAWIGNICWLLLWMKIDQAVSLMFNETENEPDAHINSIWIWCFVFVKNVTQLFNANFCFSFTIKCGRKLMWWLQCCYKRFFFFWINKSSRKFFTEKKRLLWLRNHDLNGKVLPFEKFSVFKKKILLNFFNCFVNFAFELNAEQRWLKVYFARIWSF